MNIARSEEYNKILNIKLFYKLFKRPRVFLKINNFYYILRTRVTASK